MASNRHLQACVSPNGELVAVTAPQPPSATVLRILILQRDTGSLQTTLTRRQQEDEDLTPSKILFITDTLVASLFVDRVMVWDLGRGVLGYTIEPKNKRIRYNDMAAHQGLLFLLVTMENGKTQIHQYQNERLQRKIKAGKDHKACALAVSDHYLVVRHDKLVRVLHYHDGTKVSKCSSLSDHASLVVADQAAFGLSNGKIVAVELASGMQLPGAVTADPDARDLQITSAGAGTIVSDGSCYCEMSDGKLKVAGKIQVDNQVDKTALLLFRHSLVAVLAKGGRYQVQTKRLEGDISLSLETEEGDKAEPSADTKRKASHLTVLGPGQAGGEAMQTSDGTQATKRARKDAEEDDVVSMPDDDDQGPSIADRLAKMQQALEEEDREYEQQLDARKEKVDFQPKKATTESLSELLKQALESNDDAMLELALDVRDNKVVQETVQSLSDDLVPQLLNALTYRLATKPNRASQLCHWIILVLQTGRIRSLTHLQPLRNLLQERIENFPALLQLEGRLSVVGNL